jgi:hypothetical protein
MVITGVAWLTYLAPNAAAHAVPLTCSPGFVGEAAMILWLLVHGVPTTSPDVGLRRVASTSAR